MLCQLCSSLDLAAIMRLKLWQELGIGHIRKDGFSSEEVSDWSNFEESENIFLFSTNGTDRPCHEYHDSFVPYHKTLEDLYQAAKDCDLCQALLQSAAGMIKIRKEISNPSYWPTPSGEGLFLCGLGKGQGIQLMVWGPSHIYALLGGIGFCVDDGKLIPGPRSDNLYPHLLSILIPVEGSAFASIIYGRTIPKSPRSKDGLKSMLKWLLACSTEHQHQVTSTFKPSRLLHYDPSRGKVFLSTSFPPDIRYAALSHCWGSVQPLTLNPSTKHQLTQGLPLEAFPKTFQDAFWIIQQLNIPYIWIDSLCIIQDSNDDWVHESAQMCDIYGSSYLTVAATRARNCSEGFLGQREGPNYSYVPFNVDEEYGNVAIFPMPLSRVNPYHDIIDLEEEPLSKRSWALQERYLSPRTLHFASTQMYFECRSDFYPQDHHLEQDTGMDFKIHRRETAKDNNPADSWAYIVRRYTQRYLTVETDKLPAIGGLAERVFLERGLDKSPQDEYLAGLWRKDLLVDLIWMTFAEDPKRSTPTSYTAPSWSWASVNEPIRFMGNQDTQSLAVVKGAKVDLESSESPFGKVTGGWVHLAGMKLHPYDVDEWGGIYICEGDPFFHISTHMDSTRFNLPEVCATDYMDKKSELVVVPLTLTEGDEDNDIVAAAQFLLLVSSTSGQGPTGDLPRFRRVGVGISFIDKSDGYGGDAMRRLRDRCMEAMEQKTMEDIIIV